MAFNGNQNIDLSQNDQKTTQVRHTTRHFAWLHFTFTSCGEAQCRTGKLEARRTTSVPVQHNFLWGMRHFNTHRFVVMPLFQMFVKSSPHSPHGFSSKNQNLREDEEDWFLFGLKLGWKIICPFLRHQRFVIIVVVICQGFYAGVKPWIHKDGWKKLVSKNLGIILPRPTHGRIVNWNHKTYLNIMYKHAIKIWVIE